MVFAVPPELSVLALSEEHLGVAPSCAWISVGAVAAGAVMGSTFAVQRWMQGSGDHEDGETKALLEKECDSGN